MKYHTYLQTFFFSQLLILSYCVVLFSFWDTLYIYSEGYHMNIQDCVLHTNDAYDAEYMLHNTRCIILFFHVKEYMHYKLYCFYIYCITKRARFTLFFP